MRRAVLTAWTAFNEDLEGLVTWPYLDTKGLVTVGMGNLIDPVEYAIPLPFVVSDGSLAREDQIRGAWNAVKARQDLAPRGGGAFASLTAIRLPRPAIDALVRRKLLQNESLLAARFARWYAWPADAQLACHSMAWAMGPAGFAGFPRFCAAAATSDFCGMAAESEMDPGTAHGTLITRNQRNAQCLHNSQRVLVEGLDPEQLLWTAVTTPTT